VDPRAAAAGAGFGAVKGIVHEHRLATVCEEAKCPNIGECWNAGTATIMLMGAVCTRACRFCSVDTGNPRGWLDAEEPENTARSVELMKLKYIVLTSVNRDDLPDGGASTTRRPFARSSAARRTWRSEALTPDFQGVMRDVENRGRFGLEVFAQNVETVKRLTHPVRDPRASYEQTIAVLAHAKQYKPQVLTKTSLMLGLGETDDEIAQTMDDLRAANVGPADPGQYLRPTKHHLEVQRFVTPAEFDRYREWALAKGFRECVSGPLVRSSYRAEQALAGNNAGIKNGSGAGEEIPGEAALPTVRWLGKVDYEPTWREMQRITDTRDENHARRNLAARASAGVHARHERRCRPRARRGDIPVIKIDRGGQVTYHGPGQLVVYPLIDIRRAGLGVRDLVTAMERAVIDYCASLGIEGQVPQTAPGRVRRDKKIGSVGIRIRRGASYHGLASTSTWNSNPSSASIPVATRDCR
jgi:lipoic acid synthetase